MRTVYLHGFGGTQVGPRAIDKGLKVKDPLFFDLPGFGNQDDVSDEDLVNWRAYSKKVNEEINRLIGETTPYRIVAHSHGAMVAYMLAAEHPDRIKDMVLLCPLASGSRPGRFGIAAIKFVAGVIGYEACTRLMKKTVDIFSVVSWQANWPKGALKRFVYQRRDEAKRYSPQMIKMLLMIPDFNAEYEQTRVTTRAVIVMAKGDLAVSRDDEKWYEAHLDNLTIVADKVKGGHIMPDMHPHVLAEVLKRHGVDL